ncbi:MAG: hypothetical protein MKZ95_07045 [Pirellulales bacterium]|nr:hypothetical protein [Pirellulales bacterium]
MNSTFPRLATTPVNSASSKVHVMMVGPWDTDEFKWIHQEVPETKNWQTVNCTRQACDSLDTSATPPELLLLAQPLPGQYQQAEIDSLQQSAPLARIVVISGTWCEGELRTGNPLRGVLRLYWYEFKFWWQAAHKKRAHGLCPPWSLPLDPPYAGRCVLASTNPTGDEPGTIVVSTADYPTYKTLDVMLQDYGFSTLWSASARNTPDQESGPPPQIIQGGIWDGGQLEPREFHQLQNFCQRIHTHKSPVVALLDFPRSEHIQRIREAGAQTVFGKPYMISEIMEVFR